MGDGFGIMPRPIRVECRKMRIKVGAPFSDRFEQGIEIGDEFLQGGSQDGLGKGIGCRGASGNQVVCRLKKNGDPGEEIHRLGRKECARSHTVKGTQSAGRIAQNRNGFTQILEPGRITSRLIGMKRGRQLSVSRPDLFLGKQGSLSKTQKFKGIRHEELIWKS